MLFRAKIHTLFSNRQLPFFHECSVCYLHACNLCQRWYWGQTHTSNSEGKLGWTQSGVSQLSLLMLLLKTNQDETYFSYPISIQTRWAIRFGYQTVQQATLLLFLTIFAYFPLHTFTSKNLFFRNSMYSLRKRQILIKIHKECLSLKKIVDYTFKKYKNNNIDEKKLKKTYQIYISPTNAPVFKKHILSTRFKTFKTKKR